MKEDIYKEIREKCNVWNEEQEKYYFSVVDIVQVLTDSADAKQYIKRMRSRDPELDSVWGTICTPHPPICIFRWQKARSQLCCFRGDFPYHSIHSVEESRAGETQHHAFQCGTGRTRAFRNGICGSG